MAVGEGKIAPLLAVKGIRVAAVSSNIKTPGRLDLVLFEIEQGASVAGVFTRNAFCAAPVLLAKTHLQQAQSRYLLINTGNANAGTGEAGYLDALRCCQSVADLAKVSLNEVLPFSTGVIGEPLPVDKIVVGLPEAYLSLKSDSWLAAAQGIMTTDTRPKAASLKLELAGESITITGIAKGAGMIKPNMATMLSFIATDAKIDKELLSSLLEQAVNKSFNRITVDGDTSTNDCCILVATGSSGVEINTHNREEFCQGLNQLMMGLATDLIRDAEGASKFITLTIAGGESSEECLKVAYTVAESPLVKTALFASDPNWGRILAAIGRAGLENLDVNKVSVYLGDVCIASNGAVDKDYSESKGQAEMDKQEIDIRIVLGRGACVETVWTSDLSHEYIRINAEYRT